jgi:predicted glycosyltransferase
VSRGKRILVYAQHLSGVGHHVRIREIAGSLAQTHRVVFVQGGRPVPRPQRGGDCELVELPPLRRGPRGIEPVDASRSLEAVLGARAAALAQAAAELVPDLLVVEHYPFSKWELEPEILSLVDAARAANPALELVCSARDILRRTRHERASDEDWRRRVVARLNDRFDRLLVHADPAFTRLEEHFEGAREIAIEVAYTGFVSEKPEAGWEAEREAGRAKGGAPVVVSTGGGAGSAALVERIVEAWAGLVARGAHAGRRMLVFCGLFWSESEIARLRERAAGACCAVLPFTSDFLREIAGADLSISRAGYNTCTNLLETRSRALLLPDPRMSDQHFRARRFEQHGLASVVADAEPSPGLLADAIEAALRRERPQHAFDLDGARRSCELLSR